MTMEIKIVNADSARVAEIVEQEFNVGESNPARESKSRLGPGESRSFWIHAGKTLRIVANPNG